jgi:hypothetical protein
MSIAWRGRLLGGVGVVLLAVLLLMRAAETVVLNREILYLKQEVEAIRADNERLEAEILRLSALGRVEGEARALGLTVLPEERWAFPGKGEGAPLGAEGRSDRKVVTLPLLPPAGQASLFSP